MKRISQFCLYFCLLSFLISSCCECEITEKFDGLFVKGAIVSLAHPGQIGFLEMHEELEDGQIRHSDSYLAMYDQKDLRALSMYEEYYFKVNNINGIPTAYNIQKEKPDTSLLYKSTIETRIEYHSFYEHGRKSNQHKVGHFKSGSITDLGNGNYSLLYDIEPDNDEEEVFADEEMKDLAVLLSDKDVFIDFNMTTKFITYLDTCHWHGNRLIECLEQED